jgi:hypothetical protein
MKSGVTGMSTALFAPFIYKQHISIADHRKTRTHCFKNGNQKLRRYTCNETISYRLLFLSFQIDRRTTPRKVWIGLVCCGVVTLATFSWLVANHETGTVCNHKIGTGLGLEPPSFASTTTIQLLQKQRDELSWAMSQMSKEYHQYQCTVGTKEHISSNGGWCVGGENHKTDSPLVPILEKLFGTGTVASFGEGDGAYKKLIDTSGKIKVYDSYDGAPFCENKTNGLVQFLDLSIPVYGLRLYDWVFSLEVGEHIPKKYEHTFLNNVANHAKEGIVLSWSVIGQVGHGHVNNQPLNYIVQQMDIRGFYQDKESSTMLQKACTFPYLKRNTYVYRRKPGHAVNELLL